MSTESYLKQNDKFRAGYLIITINSDKNMLTDKNEILTKTD